MGTMIDKYKALIEFVEIKRDQPFAFGSNDCCIFACDFVNMATGEDPAQVLGLRGTYSTRESAEEILSLRGGVVAIAESYAQMKGWTVPGLRYTGRADIVAVNMGDQVSLGVCLGLKSVFPSLHGIQFLDTSSILTSWRIG